MSKLIILALEIAIFTISVAIVAMPTKAKATQCSTSCVWVGGRQVCTTQCF
jgi:hypothetical protein